MRLSVGAFVLAHVALVAAHAGPPGRVDLGKRAERVSTEERAVLPENRAIEQNEVLQDRRFDAETVEKKTAIVGERRSTIPVEGREKEMFSTPDVREKKIRDRQDSVWSGKRSLISTSDDAYRTRVADRFQDRITDASPVGKKGKSALDKRTSFDRVNRFAYRRNGDTSVSAVAAGSGAAPSDISESSSVARPTSR